MKLKIGILGTRGIPNKHGGFEQFAEKFAVLMAERGHDVSVYNSHNHPYTESTFNGVRLIRCFDPEYKLGTAGQFVYDLNCILDSRKRNFDILFQLGYTSSTIWWWLLPRQSLIVTNMDGLEWKRAKYNRATKYFLKHAEKWGVQHSHKLIADSIGIEDYLLRQYQAESHFIPYGADIPAIASKISDILNKYGLQQYQYDLVIARFEPENNIGPILEAYADNKNQLLVLVGNYAGTIFGRQCHDRHKHLANIRFLGPVYNETDLNQLRYYSRLYLHGHSVGGTNPSLLEAMSCSTLIVAHDNIFNKSVLGNNAFYFSVTGDIIKLLQTQPNKERYRNWIDNNLEEIHNNYNWKLITDNLETLFTQWCKAQKR